MNDELGRTYDVFLSYAHLDADHDVANARDLAHWLEGLGYDVWWDRGLVAGDNWPKSLVAKVNAARRVIVLWSRNADASKWVHTETSLAFAADKLVPVALDDHPFPEHWGAIQHFGPANEDDRRAEILRVLAIKPGRRTAPDLPNLSADRVRLSSLPTGTGHLIGRQTQLDRLHLAWASTAANADPRRKTNVVVLHAVGGAGKTALMRHFVDDLNAENFFGAHKVYGWSAYSQGSGDNRQVDADAFMADALVFFGHDIAASPISDPIERGRTLARLVGERRCLFVIDGLEPLQEPPAIAEGRLKDRAIATFIKDLAAANRGLLLITSRQPLPELGGRLEPRILVHALSQLGEADGVALLTHLGVHGPRCALASAVKEVSGHALSLTLLGTWLDAVHGGDIAARDQLGLADLVSAEADFAGDRTSHYARRACAIMEGYAERFAALPGREGGAAEIALLSIVGLFDRPAPREAVDVLLAAPAIAGLTDVFHDLPQERREARLRVAADRLRALMLLNRVDAAASGGLDAHPLVRAYFGHRLRERAPEAFRAAHARLYDFCRLKDLPPAFRRPAPYGALCLWSILDPPARPRTASLLAQFASSKPQDLPPSLRDATPDAMREAAAMVGTPQFEQALACFHPATHEAATLLLQAIAHGCAAGRTHEAYEEVYLPRLRRGGEAYLDHAQGAFATMLTALAHFFEVPWSRPAQDLPDDVQALLLGSAGFRLRAVGRTRDAEEGFSASLRHHLAAPVLTVDHAREIAINAANLTEVRLTLGNVAGALESAAQAVAYADLVPDTFRQLANRAVQAHALYQAGHALAAADLFAQAEQRQHADQPDLPRLYSMQGNHYCDYLLAAHRHAEVLDRGAYALRLVLDGSRNLLDIALTTLTIGRALHGAWRTEETASDDDQSSRDRIGAQFAEAVTGLRRAGALHELPRGLVARAAFLRDCGRFDDAHRDLDEAEEIGGYGAMKLHLADVHLERGRLLLTELEGKSGAAHDQAIMRAWSHLGEAANLVEATGFARRLPEVKALHMALAGEIPAHVLGPDRDPEGRPASIWLEALAGP